jgi:hypothetical protein
MARLLHDPDMRVATEAARAINDLPIADAEPALAALASKFAPDERALAAAAERSAAKPTWQREMWKDRKGFTAAQLANDPIWSTKADRSEFNDECAGYSKAGNDYVQRVRGTFTAPVAGDYVFSVASDDDSILLISPKGDPAAAKQVAKVDNYVNPGDWESQPTQMATVHLEAGDAAYLEARAFQGGGGNHLAVGVVHPDGKKEQPIGSFTGASSINPMIFTFSAPTSFVTLFGGDGGGDTDSWTLTVYDAQVGGNMVGTISSGDFTGSPYLGLTLSAASILRAEANWTGQAAGVGYDDLSFTQVPLPAPVLLLGAGLAGLIGVARRRKAG